MSKVKSVMDAVNHYKAEYPEKYDIGFFFCDSEIFKTEFNTLIRECSHDAGIELFNEYVKADKKLLEKESEVKTVEYDGIVGEVNCVYMLADNTHVVLEGACEYGFIVSRVDSISKDEWHVRTIHPSTLKAGTITKAPIRLDDGAAYRIDYPDANRKGILCLYCRHENTFHNYHLKLNSDKCTNIVKLIPEVGVCI